MSLNYDSKKKCDGAGIPCGNCTRLGLECENQVRLVWEDDARRVGMKRRGPATTSRNERPKKAPNECAVSPPSLGASSYSHSQRAPATDLIPERRNNDVLGNGNSKPAPPLSQLIRYQQVSAYPRALSSTESLLLDRYIQRFSREYPTFSGPSGPFLSVFIPIAMKCGMVLDSLLALSGAQRWQHGTSSMDKESLRLRQRALKGARELLVTEDVNFSHNHSDLQNGQQHTALSRYQNPGLACRPDSTSNDNLLYLLTSSVLFLLYEKVSGEPTWKPHMEFINQFFERWLPSLTLDPKQFPDIAEAIRFLHDVFVYNDLVRSTSLRTKPLSNFYLTATTANATHNHSMESAFLPNGLEEQADFRRRYFFPNLIARLSSGDTSVTEEDIAAWDGSMDWLPSFALDHSMHNEGSNNGASPDRQATWNDRAIISELYRTAASIYRRQILGSQGRNGQHHSGFQLQDDEQILPQLASYAHLLMTSLPEASAYENALLWPIGIAAKELTANQLNQRSNILLRLQGLERRFQMRHFRKVQDVLRRHWAMRDGVSSFDTDLSDEDAILLG